MNWRGEKETATVSIIEQKIGEFLRNHTNRLRSGGPSQGTSSESFSTPAQLGQGDKTVCSTRGFQGVLADHLRASRQCVDILRREPQLKMKASEAVFIAKASLVVTAATSMQCPAENCAGGSHTPLPPACLLWWKEIGWTLMGWSGSEANASSKAVHEKISMFRRNMRRRNKGSASEVTSESSQGKIELEWQAVSCRSQVAGRRQRFCLMKHIISPNYSNWDLELRFAVDEWTVHLVGFLHCEEFDSLNQRIAREGLSTRDTAKEILQRPQVLPTTALSAKSLVEEYGLSSKRAQVKILKGISGDRHTGCFLWSARPLGNSDTFFGRDLQLI